LCSFFKKKDEYNDDESDDEVDTNNPSFVPVAIFLAGIGMKVCFL